MKYVYAAYDYSTSDSSLIGIFSTYEDAEQGIRAFKMRYKVLHRSIERIELDVVNCNFKVQDINIPEED